VSRVVGKAEALALLELEREALLGKGDGCVLCALVRRSREGVNANLLAENEHGVALLDRYASRCGHAIIVSRRHVERTAELGFAAYSELQRLAYDASIAIERSLAPVRTFIAVLGASEPVPMSFPHFHIHVLPVYETGEAARPANVFSWTTSGIVIYDDAEARELVANLKSSWPRGG
jgi:diadenosine tetraphosphate (Ap4A) HIT family hydrolase